jgi:hypothetical protein
LPFSVGRRWLAASGRETDEGRPEGTEGHSFAKVSFFNAQRGTALIRLAAARRSTFSPREKGKHLVRGVAQVGQHFSWPFSLREKGKMCQGGSAYFAPLYQLIMLIRKNSKNHAPMKSAARSSPE